MTAPAASTTAPVSDAPADLATIHGRFLWHDLTVADPDAATRFYPTVTGWTLTPWATGDGLPPYTMWTNGTVPIGGIVELSGEEGGEGAPAHWLPYIGTTDVEATYAAALALGARGLVPPRDVRLVPEADRATVGRFAVLADPQGVTFAIYEPADLGAPPAGMPAVGEVVWHDLETTDHRAALAFYAELFGWAPMAALDMGPGGVYQLVGRDGAEFGGMFDRRRDAAPAGWLSYVWVAELDRALDAVRAGGGQLLAGPMDVPGGGRVAHCVDPQGARFALHESARA